jgi:hypothetical protein
MEHTRRWYLNKALVTYAFLNGLFLVVVYTAQKDWFWVIVGVLNIAGAAAWWKDAEGPVLGVWRRYTWEVQEGVMDGWVTRETGKAFTPKGADAAMQRALDRISTTAAKDDRWTVARGQVK